MIAEQYEPKGLPPDAEAIGGFASVAHYREDAERGSRLLRDAILKSQHMAFKAPAKLCPQCHAPIQRKRRMLVADIQQTVAAYYSLPLNVMTSRDRRAEATRARQVGMYLASELTAHSMAEIGRRFDRDHTTVLHAIKATKERTENDHEMAFDVAVLRERLSR